MGVESTILSFAEEKPKLLRPGGVPLEEIQSIIGDVEVFALLTKTPSAPGMLPRHYAPRTPIVLVGERETMDSYRDKRLGLLAFRGPREGGKFCSIEVLSPKGDFREAASNLFAAIRRLDVLNLDMILAETVPEIGLGRAIMDRLRRASSEDRLTDGHRAGS